MSVRSWNRARWLALGGLALLIGALGLVFERDVHARDVLSWMDPYQYYDFARAVLQGREHVTGFEVPSIFPFLLLPALSVSPSIPAALWTNFAFTLLLLMPLAGMRCVLAIRTPLWILALLVSSSPLLLGLSRTLYVEYALSVVVAVTMVLWLRIARETTPSRPFLFALAFGLGLMLKMTFPLFLVAPVAGALLARLATGRAREVVPLMAVVVMPVAAVLLIQTAVFTRSLGYYLSLGNSSIPITHLIGPPDVLSWASFSYYFREIGRTLLFLLTPLLAVAVWDAGRRIRGAGWDGLASPRAQLWLWLLGPLVVLIVQPVKEPRHVAPCVVPAVLLIVLAAESLPVRIARAATGLAAALAVLQIFLVVTGRRETPYYMTGALHWDGILGAMLEADPIGPGRDAPNETARLLWNYRHDFVIEGFEADEALALTWLAFPGVVYDLETLDDPSRLSDAIPYSRFEDLYVLTALNTYNRRCGYDHYQATLPREKVLQHADFVVLQGVDQAAARRRFPDFELVGAVERDAGTILVLHAAKGRGAPYRALYARSFLQRHPSLPESERRVVAKELYMVAALGGYAGGKRTLLSRHPFLAEGSDVPRNIYWIGGYGLLEQLAFGKRDEPAVR